MIYKLHVNDSFSSFSSFDIWPYFQPAYSYINYGRIGGRVLIYDSGVSRGGAIALAFLIRDGELTCWCGILNALRNGEVMLCQDGIISTTRAKQVMNEHLY